MSERSHTPTPFAPFVESPPAPEREEPDTDRPAAPPGPVDPHDMSTRELLIEAVIFGREHGKLHSDEGKRLAEGDRLFRQIDAEIEMCMTSIETLCRINHAHEAADELGKYLREKREMRNARSDAANGNSPIGHG